MNLKKLKARLEQLAQRPADRELLLRVVDEVGHELTRGRPDVLRQFRAEADAACRLLAESGVDPNETAFARGGLMTLMAVAKMVDLEQQHQQQQETTRALFRRPWFREVLESLRGASATTTAIARLLGRDKAQVSRILQDLKAAGLVRAVDRSRFGDQREQPYRLSVTGALQLTRLGPLGRSVPSAGAEQRVGAVRRVRGPARPLYNRIASQRRYESLGQRQPALPVKSQGTVLIGGMGPYHRIGAIQAASNTNMWDRLSGRLLVAATGRR